MEEETKISIVKSKDIKSTTNVKGIIVECSDNKYYVITKLMPSRNPWFIRCVSSNKSGKTTNSTEIFSLNMGAKGEPDLQLGKDLLIEILNGADAPKDRMFF